MDSTTKLFIAFALFKFGLDLFSTKRPNIWFDVVYIAMFLILGLWALNSGNSFAGLGSLGVAIIWGGWIYARESGLLAKEKKHKRKK